MKYKCAAECVHRVYVSFKICALCPHLLCKCKRMCRRGLGWSQRVVFVAGDQTIITMHFLSCYFGIKVKGERPCQRNKTNNNKGRRPRRSPAAFFRSRARACAQLARVRATSSSSGWDEGNNQNTIIQPQRAAITSLLF